MLNGLHLIGFVCFIFFFGNNLLVPGTDEIQEPTDVHVIIISQTSLNVLNQNKDRQLCLSPVVGTYVTAFFKISHADKYKKHEGKKISD